MLAERHDIQPQLMQRIRTNLAALDQRLAAQNLCQRLDVEGGWYAVLRVPMLGSDEDLADRPAARNRRVAAARPFLQFPGEGYLVASLITPTDQFAAAISRALQFIAAP